MKENTSLSIRFIGLMLIITAFVSVDAAAQKINTKQLTAEYDRMLSEKFRQGETGCAALVAKDGQIIYKKAFGMADLELNVPMQPDMVFRIGSITKQFTAVAILQLMEQGKLSLQDDITKYIPDYPTHGYNITIEHLLTHTSGIKSYTNVPEFQKYVRQDLKPEEAINTFRNLPMEFAPGTKWNYNNSGYFLLGYIIEKVSGKTYQEYIDENFFKPLGMTGSCYGSDSRIIKNRASGYQHGKDGVQNADFLSMLLPYSAGSIQSTVEDLYRWNQALHSYKVVSKESLDKAFTEYKLANGKGTGYGYGWFLSQLQGSKTIEHGGGINGFLTNAIYFPEEDLFVALFSNNMSIGPDFTSQKMAALALGKPLKDTPINIDEATLGLYVGVYKNEDGKEITVSRDSTHLTVLRPGSPVREIIPVEKDRFLLDDSFISLSFNRDAAGKISLVKIDDRGKVTEWVRTDKAVEAKKVVEVDESLLMKYAGEYELQPGFTITFTCEGKKLFTQATGQERFEIFPESNTKFFLKVVDAQVEFIQDESGKYNKIILYQGGRSMEAKRIR
ncbi:MAG: serine hydrolase [Bacteroidales bacterium]|nr:serine hydrolase [Bacteroidales bacterium]